MKEWFAAEAIRFSIVSECASSRNYAWQVLLASAYVKQTSAFAAAELAPN